MNKAKAVFSGVMVLAVAGASAACWYLNDKGLIGKSEETTTQAYVEYDNNEKDNNIQNNIINDEKDEAVNEEISTTAENKEDIEISNDAVNDFLSVFSKVYFSEKDIYTSDKINTYELIRFAYSHLKRTDDEAVEIRQVNDNIGYYSCVSSDEVNEVLEKYLGVSVPEESVYTENDYAFFKYSDGYFMTPAADGLPFINTCVSDSIDVDENMIKVRFTVYSGEDKYANGEAEIKITDDGMNLVYYRLKK